MRTVLFGLGLALVGCGGITPMSGDYEGTVTLAADTCGMIEDGVEVGDSEEFMSNIVFNEDGSVVFDDDEGFECTAAGATVTCAFTELQTEDGADYTITQEITAEMVWDTNTSFAGWQTLSISCEGADCAVFDDYGYSFPCSTDYDLVGSMAEDAAE